MPAFEAGLAVRQRVCGLAGQPSDVDLKSHLHGSDVVTRTRQQSAYRYNSGRQVIAKTPINPLTDQGYSPQHGHNLSAGFAHGASQLRRGDHEDIASACVVHVCAFR